MAKEADSKKQLIKGIEKDAKEEARRIIAEAEKQAGERRESVEIQAASIIDEANKKAQLQADAIISLNKSNINVESKRRSLKKREETLILK